MADDICWVVGRAIEADRVTVRSGQARVPWKSHRVVGNEEIGADAAA